MLTQDGQRLKIEVSPKQSQAELETNILASTTADYPFWVPVPRPWHTPPMGCALVGGGHSAKLFRGFDGPVVTMNASWRLLDRPPTYHVMLEAGEHAAEYVRDAPKSTIYLIASRVHPKTFEALAGRDVRLWHAWEPAAAARVKGMPMVPGGNSVMHRALNLMAMMGYSDMHVWGFDCSMPDDRGPTHATGRRQLDQEFRICEVGDREFITSLNWLEMARSFLDQMSHGGVPYGVTLHGDGMLQSVVRLESPINVFVAPGCVEPVAA